VLVIDLLGKIVFIFTPFLAEADKLLKAFL
jgi:hypothetical protein